MGIDRKIYPSDWAEIRERILSRAAYKCEHCGVDRWAVGYRQGKNNELKTMAVGSSYKEAIRLRALLKRDRKEKVLVIRLTTAHLDHNEWEHNVPDDRLACLCEKCHFHYDRQDNELRKKYGKHYKRHQLTIFSTK